MKRLVISTFFFLTMIISQNGHAGGMTSSGGELVVHGENPWFIGGRPVFYCIERSENFSVPLDVAKLQIREALDDWKATFQSLPHGPISRNWEDGEHKALSLEFVELPICSSQAELRFRLGTESLERSPLSNQMADVTYAYARPVHYDFKTGRWSGDVWFAPDLPQGFVFSETSPAGPTNISNLWRDKAIFFNTVLHELGHVFGIKHAYGSIMSPEFVARVFNYWGGYKRRSSGTLATNSWLLGRTGNNEICTGSNDGGMSVGPTTVFLQGLAEAFPAAHLEYHRIDLCFRLLKLADKDIRISIEVRKGGGNVVDQILFSSTESFPSTELLQSREILGKFPENENEAKTGAALFLQPYVLSYWVRHASLMGTFRHGSISYPGHFEYSPEERPQVRLKVMTPKKTLSLTAKTIQDDELFSVSQDYLVMPPRLE